MEYRCSKYGHTSFSIVSQNGRKKKICTVCRAEKKRSKRRNNKIRAIKFLGGKCQECGYSHHPGSLHFHHTGIKEKEFSISKILDYSWSKIESELRKCVLLCANCHHKEHSQIIDSKNIHDASSWKVRRHYLCEAFGGKCLLCAEDDYRCLQFHHLDKATKKFTLSKTNNLEKRPKMIWEEALKCVILCANCHSEIECNKIKIDFHSPASVYSFEEWSDNISKSKLKTPEKSNAAQRNLVRKKLTNICLDCNSIISPHAKRCLQCQRLKRRKVKRPSLEELKYLVDNDGYSATGKKYGVSDNAIRKWLKHK